MDYNDINGKPFDIKKKVKKQIKKIKSNNAKETSKPSLSKIDEK